MEPRGSTVDDVNPASPSTNLPNAVVHEALQISYINSKSGSYLEAHGTEPLISRHVRRVTCMGLLSSWTSITILHGPPFYIN